MFPGQVSIRGACNWKDSLSGVGVTSLFLQALGTLHNGSRQSLVMSVVQQRAPFTSLKSGCPGVGALSLGA